MEDQPRPQSALNTIVLDVEQYEDKPTDSESTRKRNKSSTKQKLLNYFDDCSLRLRQVKEREITPTEKIVWFLMFTICFIYCGFLIWKSYSKWINSPAIVMLTENDRPIREIPFPAVTICPERKVLSEMFDFKYYRKLYYNETYGDFTEQELNMYEDVSLICDNFYYIRFSELSEKRRNFTYGSTTVDNIIKNSLNLSQVMRVCFWKGIFGFCDDIFTPILTEEGMCFTFNTIGPEDLFDLDNMHTDYEYMEKLYRTRNQGWTMDNGYPFDAPGDTFPARGSGAGTNAGLRILLGEMKDGLDKYCKRRNSGFKVLLHNPGDLPRPSQLQYINIQPFEEIILSFTASLEVTSNGLEVFPPLRRQCYFSDERKLKYFKLYTQSNCEYECLTNFTFARCGCVHFSMPHSPNMAICNVGRVKCMDQAQMELSTMEIKVEGSGNVTTEEAIRIAKECNCLSACSSMTYETEILYRDQLRDEEKYESYNNSTVFKQSVIKIFFKRPLFDISKRSELYGTNDILASCGGLLGLFMGFSVINIIEILYLCILSVYRRRKADKCEHPNKQAVQHSKDKIY